MKRNNKDVAHTEHKDYSHVFAIIISFLSNFVPVTLAKRIVCIILLAAGVEDAKITEWTSYCDRSVRGVRKEMEDGKDISELLKIGGGGRKSKLEDYEDQIIAELECNNYHTRKQVADMIYNKFEITVSLSAVGRFLKKTALKS